MNRFILLRSSAIGLLVFGLVALFAMVTPFPERAVEWLANHDETVDDDLVISAVISVLSALTAGALLYASRLRRALSFVCLCAWCGRARVEEQDWVALERFLRSTGAAQFTHGICPDCLAHQLDAVDRAR